MRHRRYGNRPNDRSMTYKKAPRYLLGLRQVWTTGIKKLASRSVLKNVLE